MVQYTLFHHVLIKIHHVFFIMFIAYLKKNQHVSKKWSSSISNMSTVYFKKMFSMYFRKIWSFILYNAQCVFYKRFSCIFFSSCAYKTFIVYFRRWSCILKKNMTSIFNLHEYFLEYFVNCNIKWKPKCEKKNKKIKIREKNVFLEWGLYLAYCSIYTTLA